MVMAHPTHGPDYVAVSDRLRKKKEAALERAKREKEKDD